MSVLLFLLWALYGHTTSQLEFVASMATVPFALRFPQYPFVEITLGNGQKRTVPRMAGYIPQWGLTWQALDADGDNRTLTRITFPNGEHIDSSMFEDELLYYLIELGGVELVHYDYTQHKERRTKFSQSLRPGQSPHIPTQAELFQAPPENVRESSPTDLSRVGPSSDTCSICNEPVPDGQQTVVMGNDRVCFACASDMAKLRDEEGMEQNAAFRDLLQQVDKIEIAQKRREAAKKAAATKKRNAKAKAAEATA
jgi:hypothetical protein